MQRNRKSPLLLPKCSLAQPLWEDMEFLAKLNMVLCDPSNCFPNYLHKRLLGRPRAIADLGYKDPTILTQLRTTPMGR